MIEIARAPAFSPQGLPLKALQRQSQMFRISSSDGDTLKMPGIGSPVTPSTGYFPVRRLTAS